jgi:hypothetical protein
MELLAGTAYLPNDDQLAWDNTSLDLLRECARKYYYHNRLGIRSKTNNPHLIFGILYHECLEYYDHRRAEGDDHWTAENKTIRYTLRVSHGWESDHKKKNRRVLVRAVSSYLSQFWNDRSKTVILDNGKPAVELSFRYEIDLQYRDTDLKYVLCGHLDRLAELDGDIWNMDKKTSGNYLGDDYIQQFKPNSQILHYTYSTRIVYSKPVKGVMIDAVHLDTKGDNFGRFPVLPTAGQLEEWLENTKFLIKMAEQYASAGFWPMNTKACHNYNGCPYRELCGKDPQVREIFIRSNYTQFRWDPLVVRERTL